VDYKKGLEWNGPCIVIWWSGLGGVEEELEWNHSLRWDYVLKDFFCVKRVICDIGEQRREYGSKLNVYSCNGKRLGDFQSI
jgi:hypothetical protein